MDLSRKTPFASLCFGLRLLSKRITKTHISLKTGAKAQHDQPCFAFGVYALETPLQVQFDFLVCSKPARRSLSSQSSFILSAIWVISFPVDLYIVQYQQVLWYLPSVSSIVGWAMLQSE